MKTLIITILLAAGLAGCSSHREAHSEVKPDTQIVERIADSEAIINSGIDVAMNLSAAYCNHEGFSRFSESKRYYMFTCKDGSKYRVSVK